MAECTFYVVPFIGTCGLSATVSTEVKVSSPSHFLLCRLKLEALHSTLRGCLLPVCADSSAITRYISWDGARTGWFRGIVSGDSGFESVQGHRLYWLKFFLVLVCSSRKCWDSTVASFEILSISSFFKYPPPKKETTHETLTQLPPSLKVWCLDTGVTTEFQILKLIKVYIVGFKCDTV
jgi:hypothetical protein